MKRLVRISSLFFIFAFFYFFGKFFVTNVSDEKDFRLFGKLSLHDFIKEARADHVVVDNGGEGCSCGGAGGDSSGGSCSCFVRGTPVLMADKSAKPIEEVLTGDSVMSFDTNGALVNGKVVDTIARSETKLLSVNGLRVTPEHVVMSAQGEWRPIGTFKIGEKLMDLDGGEVEITDIKELPAEPVFNLTVEPFHTYIAQNIRVHNMS